MEKVIITGARVICADSDSYRDLYIEDGLFTSVKPVGARVINLSGKTVFPGLIDMHVHFRDPGYTEKEDILSGAEAAAAGGITTALCMPNTNPVIDTPDGVLYIINKASGAKIRVLPYAAVTAGQKGEALTDFAALQKAGAVTFSDDGSNIDSADIMMKALISAESHGALIISHCEDTSLARNYAVNEGAVSRMLKIPGRPAAAEEIAVSRDCILARETGARLHIAHVSTKGSVDIIRREKERGTRVTCETCPQYFILTEEIVPNLGALARVNPPLRTARDRTAIIEGLQDGTIDAIATDHAPHTIAEKLKDLESAPSGMIGLETSLALTLNYLYHTGILKLSDIARLMSYNPAKILGLPYGKIEPGTAADITAFDLNEEWTITEASFKSKSRNTPFINYSVKGKAYMTIVNGNISFGGENVF